MESPVVDVVEGKISGKHCKTSNNTDYFTFKSIPYAKPPVGVLRFAAPQPPEPWDGVRDGTKDCNICAQLDRESFQVVGDEDCLYLNVSTPSLPKADLPPLPVMVFFHGGGFLFGNGTDDSVHGPDYLVEKNVVVVTLNYRLGILGFLSLGCKEAPGNMGLKDQVQALIWIKNNIKNFNGDPNNVTIFGVSAGGASVELQMLSPMSKGLFHKAIAQSGSSLLHWSQNNNIKELVLKFPIIKKKNITDSQDLLQLLKNLSTKDLITMSMLVIGLENSKGGLNFGFVPTVEEDRDWEPFLTKSPYDLLKQGEIHKVPYMTGYCDREGLLMMYSIHKATFDTLVRDKDFLSLLPFDLDNSQKTELQTKLKNIYLEGVNKYNESDFYAIDFFSDVDFCGGIFASAELISKHISPLYFYEFSYDGNLNYLKKKLNIDRKGACHGDEGGYLVKSGLLQGDITDTDRLVRERMCRMWTNFAKFGDPTPTIDEVITTTWEPLAETGFNCLMIDDKLSMKEDARTERTKLFQELFSKCSKR
ncbi:juvenile hormone esterase-like [Danaus plexippus]|uniref:juvenile hormone esterase-like n=1 Tax=Danaus plexippus TaxID=13037 RepID=UPI002AAFB7EE|nr:juvenile hormone esterase-like [Danaus plexippus]